MRLLREILGILDFPEFLEDSKPDLATLVFKEEDLECSPIGLQLNKLTYSAFI